MSVCVRSLCGRLAAMLGWLVEEFEALEGVRRTARDLKLVQVRLVGRARACTAARARARLIVFVWVVCVCVCVGVCTRACACVRVQESPLCLLRNRQFICG